MAITDKITELIRLTSTSLPEDVERTIKKAYRREEKGSPAATILKTILDNVELARSESTPLCQDTGTLTFFVDERLRRRVTPSVIANGVRKATKLGYLRKNCIDSISGASYDDNVAIGSPIVHYVLAGEGRPTVTLIMKGGGSENMSRQYSLPDETLNAGRDLDGVGKCIIDAVRKTKGYGCAPGILGVCIGGDRAGGYEVAKEALLSKLGKMNKFEKRIFEEANATGIGPMGLGGKTTLLSLKIVSRSRLPASFFVTIAYMCWALRRQTMEF